MHNNFVTILIMFIKTKRQKEKEKENVFDLMITKKNSLNTAFHEDD